LSKKPLGPAGSRKESQVYLGQAETCRPGGYANVCAQNKFGTTAKGETVNGSDGRLFGKLDLSEDAVQPLAELKIMLKAVARIEIGNVTAGDESLAGSRYDCDTNFRSSSGQIKCIIELGKSCHVQRIERFRAIDGDYGNLIFPL
jgi:hypothetical protein